MLLGSAVNVYGVNAVYFLLSQAAALLGLPSQTAAVCVRESIIFLLGGFLLPCWALYIIELQARERFIATRFGLALEDVGRFWADHPLLAHRRHRQRLSGH